MIFENINSTSVESLEYKEEELKLIVEYKGGSMYEYLNVPPTVASELENVDSIGSYINSEIKGSYAFEKLS